MPQQNTNNTNTNAGLIKFAKICAIVDFLWAAAVATLYATVLHAFVANPHTNVSGGEALTATVLTWVITFVAAFIQGAIFIGVFSVIGFVVYYLCFGNRNAAQNNGDQNNNNNVPNDRPNND